MTLEMFLSFGTGKVFVLLQVTQLTIIIIFMFVIHLKDMY